MRNALKLIRRFVLALFLLLFLLMLLNLFLLGTYAGRYIKDGSDWQVARVVAEGLWEAQDGSFSLSESAAALLEEQNAWAILVEDQSGAVSWHSANLPEEIPLSYTLSEIVWGSRGYIEDYPTATAAHGEDLVVVGHPKTAYWKLLWNSFDYELIAHVPELVVVFLLANIAVIFVIYMAVTTGVLRSVKPIVRGIEALPGGEDVYVRERGLLSDLAAAINRASERLKAQERALKQRDMARANWIRGVSHDIRTPLSMVMGYAGQLEEAPGLGEEERGRARRIRIQSIRMKNLIRDLNLASRLEYNMQPLSKETLNLTAVIRQTAADFMNLDSDGKYPLTWTQQEELTVWPMEGDKNLLHRAFDNILTNIQVHNPEGCGVFIELRRENDGLAVCIEDDGVGVSEEQLNRLIGTPHYMMSDGKGGELRHGLGLQIVRQIAAVHEAGVFFAHGREGRGFCVRLVFPAGEGRRQGIDGEREKIEIY